MLVRGGSRQRRPGVVVVGVRVSGERESYELRDPPFSLSPPPSLSLSLPSCSYFPPPPHSASLVQIYSFPSFLSSSPLALSLFVPPEQRNLHMW